jgi:hypothetical protein
MVQSFFSINHVDLGALSGYGMIGGVQWPWTINLILYHATISTLIPIAMVELLWPHYTYVPVLRKRSLVLIGTAVGIDTVVFMNFVWSLQKNYPVPYVLSPVLMVGSCVVIGLLIWCAYRFRSSRLRFVSGRLFHPLSMAVLGFLLQSFLLLAAMLASGHVPGAMTIVIQGVVLTVVGAILVRQLLHQQREVRHLVGFIIGSLLFWILLAPVNEFANKMLGMSLVGISAVVLLFYWRHSVLRTEPNNVVLQES